MAENEMILSQNMAKTLEVSKGDSLEFNNTEYEIKDIEKSSRGVGKQGEEMGYAKLSKYDQDEKYAYAKLFLIQGENINKIKEDLENIEDAFTYTTVSDVKRESEEQINTNVMSLNMINTMSIIMTIISLISSVFLILTKCERDIAIMKIESIKNNVIRKTFQIQFYCYVFPSVLLGAICSIFMAYGILMYNGVSYRFGSENITKLIIGIIFLGLAYVGYIKIACKRIDDILPLSILKSEEIKKRNWRIVWRAIVLTILFFFAYAIYINVTSVFAVSLLIVLLIGIFYVLFLTIIWILTCMHARKAINRYLFLHMREKKHAIALTVMSLTFTILFFLVGFTLSETIADSFSKSLKSKINYNYMISTTQEENLENVLKQTDNTGKYTKINMIDVGLYKDEKFEELVILASVEKDSYGVKYILKQGEDVINQNSEGVMLSTALAEKYDYELNDNIILELFGEKKLYCIRGLYESGGMNDNHIIINYEMFKKNTQKSMYLVNIKDSSVFEKIENVSIVNLDTIGSNLEKSLEKTLSIFKALCIICILSAIIFNINIMYMKVAQDHRNLVLMRALGLNRYILVKNVVVECMIMFLLTIVMSLGVYYFIIT